MATPARRGASNVLPADYAGSAACAGCHADVAAAWSKTPMHNMTREAATASISAPFDGPALRFKDDRVDLAEAAGARFVSVRSKTEGDHVYRVTRVIGGHHREDYAGVEVGRVGDALAKGEHDELVLPVSYLLFSKKFRYKGYSVMSKERPGLRAGPVWNRTCIFCHNTESYFSVLLGALPEGRGEVYQGVTVDALLPEAKRWRLEVSDREGLDRALEAEIRRFGGTPRAPRGLVAQAIDATRAGYAADDLIEVGIGCESCHSGSRAHVEAPNDPPSLVPRAPFFTIVRPSNDTAAAKADAVNHACARCHQVLFSRYPYTWEGGERARDPGGSHINSGEGRDFMLGACATRADCTVCHDPHAPDDSPKIEALRGKEGDRVCVHCHAKYEGDAALRAHAHHDPDKAGARCMACHMPEKNMSLDLRLTRYHRIGSPTDREKQKDRPLECALCHADKSAREILETMERWWNKSYDRTLPTLLYGDLEASAMRRTLALGKPHEKAVALYVLGEAKNKADLPSMEAELLDPYPLVRYYAEAALEKVTGEKSPLDLGASDEEIRERARQWLSKGQVQ